MMGRLIDADKLYESLIENISFLKEQDYETYCAVGDTIRFVIDQQPTDSNMDKVVKQLEERTSFLKDCTKYGNKTVEQQSKSYDTMMMYEIKDLVDDLLEIVKEGGTDNE